MKFRIQKEYDGREKLAIHSYCLMNDVQFEISNCTSFDINTIPVGSVEWVEEIIGRKVPNYYPSFLSNHLHRRVWYSENIEGDWAFYKPADAYKRFPGKLLHPSFYDEDKMIGNECLLGPYMVSDIVNFKNEWRYYISDGEVLGGWWYSGEEDTGEAPILDIKFPKTFCGAVDFGEFYNGKIALVESHHPYAIGWYGEDSAQYAKFLISGWKYIQP